MNRKNVPSPCSARTRRRAPARASATGRWRTAGDETSWWIGRTKIAPSDGYFRVVEGPILMCHIISTGGQDRGALPGGGKGAADGPRLVQRRAASEGVCSRSSVAVWCAQGSKDRLPSLTTTSHRRPVGSRSTRTRSSVTCDIRIASLLSQRRVTAVPSPTTMTKHMDHVRSEAARQASTQAKVARVQQQARL